ncbi:MAG: DNA-processing protein DprA [Eubacterium sp.]
MCGALIISGGALGVDSCAHRGALEAGGKTVAVLETDSARLFTAKQGASRIDKENGALVTEYPPFTPASAYFPMRNRIISGLSLGVMVVEAGVKSARS